MIAALAVAARMDLAGPIVPDGIVDLLAGVGRGQVTPPAAGNHTLYSCFFATAVADGVPSVVPTSASGLDPCR